MTLFRPEVEALQAYAMPDGRSSVKINQNEAPWDWPEELKARACEALATTAFNRYPPFVESSLTRALARRWDLEPASVLVGNGSNELLQGLFTTALGPGRTVCIPSPSFALYAQLAMLSGGRAVPLELAGGVSYDPDLWSAAVRRESPNVVLLCSPNNPTGAVYPAPALEALAQETRALLVVDEAYGDFSAEASACRLIERHENVVVLRTFSKAWAAAGLRLGYALAAPRTAEQIRKGILPYNLSPLTASMGVLALENAAWFEAGVRRIVAERDRLSAGLGRIEGLTVYPSHANFLLVRLNSLPAARVHELLKNRGVLVRDVSNYPMLQGCLRLSVGTPAENDDALKALSEVMS